MKYGLSLISLSGAAGSGKDTAADALEADGWGRVALADPMRELLLKIDPIVSGVRLSAMVAEIGWSRAKREYPEVRRLLIATGEGARKVLGADCWIKAAKLTDSWVQNYQIVVTDVRPHDGDNLTIEADWIHEEGGIVVRVERPGLENTIDHYTETNLDKLPYDALIQNDGTVEDLHSKIREVAESLL